MKAYSLDLREKIVHAVESGESSIRKTAQRFSVSKSCVQKFLAQKRHEGHLNPRKQGGSKQSSLLPYQEQLLTIVQQSFSSLKPWLTLFEIPALHRGFAKLINIINRFPRWLSLAPFVPTR
jgi:transposase